MSSGRLVVLVLASVLLSACQSGGGGLVRQDDSQGDRIRELQRELVEARQRAVMAEVEAERLESKVDSLERELRDARSRAQQAPPARNAGQVIEDVSINETASRTTIEEVELEEPSPSPTTRATPSPQTTQTTPPSTPSSTQPPTPAGQTISSGDDESAQSLYDQAYTLFHEKRYAEAESAFGRFLSRHSDSHLADNAQFWIGESRWARGDFSSALSAFMATVEGYPHGNKVADALLKAGRCLEALGQKSRAVATYEELVTRFPSSAAAISAQERLGDLRR